MALTNASLLQYVYAHLGGSEKDSGIIEPLIIAMAELAYADLAQMLLDTDSELAKKLITSVANQTWSSSSFAAPTNMLFYKQKKTTRMDFGGTLAYQVEDRDKLDLVAAAGISNTYYALEGKTFYIKSPAGTTSGTNLNLRYYKIPTVSDIDDDLRNIFLEILIRRLVPQSTPKQ